MVEEKEELKSELSEIEVLNKKIEELTEKNKMLEEKVLYKDKKITDSYQEDYIKGNTYFKYLEKKLQKDIKKNLDIKTTIDIAKKIKMDLSKSYL